MGLWAWGKEGSGREPTSRQSSCALGRRTLEDCRTLSMRPRVGIWLFEATDPTWRGWGWGWTRGSPWYQVLSLRHPTLDTAEEMKTE